MAQLISVKLARFDGSPWGFRLQGGKDFGTPLIVQKVNGGSPAEQAGLRAGDAVIRVNSTDMFNLRHKDAQDVIVRSGNSFEITVQRGGSTWRPSVSPVTPSIPSPQPNAPASCISPVTKTSLAAKKQDAPLIGSGHNFTPKPFLNGSSEGPIKSIVNKQYNSPVGIYSEETIAETLSAQAEVLAGGVLGVNFKKNEKNYNAQNSEVFKMVQEADKEPRSPEPAEPVPNSGVISPPSPAIAGLRSVSAPETKPQPTTPQGQLPPGQNICADCERLIVGVFVRIKEKNLHVECFKCSTCGTSLKNVGYYNINNKLYCDIHAKLVARQQAPSGLTPITIPPGGKAPAGTISAALANLGGGAPLSPSLNSHGSPQPFSARNNRRQSGDLGVPQRRPSRTDLPSYYAPTNGHDTPTNGTIIYDERDSYTEEDSCNAKTYTSTITIRTGNEVGRLNDRVNELYLDDNRNPTNKLYVSRQSDVTKRDNNTITSSSSFSPPLKITTNGDESSRFIVFEKIGMKKDTDLLNGSNEITLRNRENEPTIVNSFYEKIGKKKDTDLLNGSNEIASRNREQEPTVVNTFYEKIAMQKDTDFQNGSNDIASRNREQEPAVVNTCGVPRYQVTNQRLKTGTFSSYHPSNGNHTTTTSSHTEQDDRTSETHSNGKEPDYSNATTIGNRGYQPVTQRLFTSYGNSLANSPDRLEDNLADSPKSEYEANYRKPEGFNKNNCISGFRSVNGRPDSSTSAFTNYRSLPESFSSGRKNIPSPPSPPETMSLSTSLMSSTRPNRLGSPPVDTPSFRPVQSHTSNNISGPKPFGGSSVVAPSSFVPAAPVINSGSNTLPRPQSQTVTANGENGNNLKNGHSLKDQGCCVCNKEITRGPFITALGQIWCPEHFVCVNSQCRRALQDIGFVEEKGQLHCEYCFERFIAPACNKCNSKIKGDCLNAVGKHFHPECFNCSYCGKLFGNSPFFLEEGLPYCEADWNELFTTKCYACGFPVEAGDRWVEALNNNYHSQCFNCTMCKKNLEGQSFYAKGGRPFCKNHAR